MQLTEEQKQHVARWIAEGLKLADIQRRLDEEYSVRLTYMETRFLIDDLQLTPQDPLEPEPPAEPMAEAMPAGPSALAEEGMPTGELLDAATAGPVGAGVQVKVDAITRPGAVVSGSVVFTDGGKADWYLDQTGRLGLQAEVPGYRPPQPDIAQFQIALERELGKMGI